MNTETDLGYEISRNIIIIGIIKAKYDITGLKETT